MKKIISLLIIASVLVGNFLFASYTGVFATDVESKMIKVKTMIIPVDSTKAEVTTLEPIVWLKDVKAIKRADGRWTVGMYNKNDDNTGNINRGFDGKDYPGVSPESAKETYFINKDTGKITHQGVVWHKVTYSTAGSPNGTGVTISVGANINSTFTDEQLEALATNVHNQFMWKMFVKELDADFDKADIEVPSEKLTLSLDKVNSVDALKKLVTSSKALDGSDGTDSLEVVVKEKDSDVAISDLTTLESGKEYVVTYNLVKKAYNNPVSTFSYGLTKSLAVNVVNSSSSNGSAGGNLDFDISTPTNTNTPVKLPSTGVR